MIHRFNKYQVATFIAALFHIIGFFGILYEHQGFFVKATVFNLLLSFLLLIWTQKDRNNWFILFFLATFFVGFGVEVVGVNTTVLFGEYKYGNILGPEILHVPVIIGINWFVIIYCCGISMHTLLVRAINRMTENTGKKPLTLKSLSVIIDGATIAVFFDWVMEPVAIKLGFWQWRVGGAVPGYNYFCWLLVSMALLAIFHFCKFNKQNNFAVNLLLIQLMFFLLLRTLLK